MGPIKIQFSCYNATPQLIEQMVDTGIWDLIAFEFSNSLGDLIWSTVKYPVYLEVECALIQPYLRDDVVGFVRHQKEF